MTRSIYHSDGYRCEKVASSDSITAENITKEKDMANKDKPTADLDELMKVLGPEQLAALLPKEPKYPMKGRGFQRTKFNVTQQGLQTEISKAFYRWLPQSHKCTFTNNNTVYKGISPEATSIWILMERYKLDLTVDYETLLAFDKRIQSIDEIPCIDERS